MKLLIACAFIFTSCATDTFEKKTSLENVYLSNGIEKYFLTPLADWSNYSTSGSCFRKIPVKYLNFENLKNNYNLTYEQMISLQHTFNRKIQAYSMTTSELPLKDEAFIFYNSYEQVIGGSREFVIPKFKKISLVWIDPYLKSKTKDINALFNKKGLMEGHPVLISTCLSSIEMEEFSEKHNLSQYGVKHMSAEMFSIYNSSNQKNPYLGIELPLILKDKEINYFGKSLPIEFIGIEKR